MRTQEVRDRLEALQWVVDSLGIDIDIDDLAHAETSEDRADALANIVMACDTLKVEINKIQTHANAWLREEEQR